MNWKLHVPKRSRQSNSKVVRVALYVGKKDTSKIQMSFVIGSDIMKALGWVAGGRIATFFGENENAGMCKLVKQTENSTALCPCTGLKGDERKTLMGTSCKCDIKIPPTQRQVMSIFPEYPERKQFNAPHKLDGLGNLIVTLY